MSKSDFDKLNNFFRNDNFLEIEKSKDGMKFLKLRTISRKKLLKDFCLEYNIDVLKEPSKEWFELIFNNSNVMEEQIDKFIRYKYAEERKDRVKNEEYLIDQLNRLQYFDWGGSYGNSLEKNIVNNYVKKIQCYDKINMEIEGSLLSSMRGYTLNSWYNHWTSILIEDLFKSHSNVLPTVGLVKKIDFFINNIPFDLKVTYFPEQLLAEKLKNYNISNELSELRKICKKLEISIPKDLKNKQLKAHLYNKVSEDHRDEARKFISDLDDCKQKIIQTAKNNPLELKKWFYENQGELRFDASNRFFLVLIDKKALSDSWKLKRRIEFLREKIAEHLNQMSTHSLNLDLKFFWKKDKKFYNCKSDILFLEC